MSTLIPISAARIFIRKIQLLDFVLSINARKLVPVIGSEGNALADRMAAHVGGKRAPLLNRGDDVMGSCGCCSESSFPTRRTSSSRFHGQQSPARDIPSPLVRYGHDLDDNDIADASFLATFVSGAGFDPRSVLGGFAAWGMAARFRSVWRCGSSAENNKLITLDRGGKNPRRDTSDEQFDNETNIRF
ncbi:MAG: hypothetical protein U0787_12875 [Polyangia bacterium]